MFVLTMAALLGNQNPAVILNYTKNFTNSHDSPFLWAVNMLTADERPRSPGWRTNGVKVAKPETVNEGNTFEKPNAEPTPVHRLVRPRGVAVSVSIRDEVIIYGFDP
jgi:hypothetical protein